MVVFFVKYLPKRESTHANVQSCSYNERGLYGSMIKNGLFVN